jgi:hypothetical protein
VFEEKLMNEDNAAPLLVVGMEGVWGSLLMPLVVFPWAEILPGSDAGGCMENMYDSWVMIINSQTVSARGRDAAATRRSFQSAGAGCAVSVCDLIPSLFVLCAFRFN